MIQQMQSRESLSSFLFTLFGFKKASSWIHILLIILIHITGWCFFFFLPVMLYPVRINDNRFITREVVDKLVLIVLFYLHYYWLIPSFFEKKKYFSYSSLVILAFLLYFSQHLAVRFSYFDRPGGPIQFFQAPLPPAEKQNSITSVTRDGRVVFINDVMIGIDSVYGSRPYASGILLNDSIARAMPGFPMREPGLLGIPKGIWAMSLNNTISSFALLLLMGGFIRLAHSFVKSQNEKKILENANLNAEVNFLKSQINPHFLFNTLNGIYSQAHAKSEHTEHSILKLSDLLRYVLYESGEDKVALSKDIQYLSNYVDLQKLRLSQKVKIEYEVTGEATGHQIAPLLLITFVENAFKHGISYTNPSVIKIQLQIFEKTLTLLVSNPVTETNSFAGGGLGLKNVIRRLDLLYPDKYWLDIIHNDHLHIVNLKINLNSD
jgi:two-component system LytT family sensor kinase